MANINNMVTDPFISKKRPKAFLLFLHVFRLYAQGRMWNQFQTLLVDELTGHTANAIGFILYSHQSIFKVPDEFFLTYGQLGIGFLAHGLRTFLESFKGWGSIIE